ncbi:MAG TPA: hypothetical protein VLD39_08175, partial [Gammaproteobacteria bacterium]|nr:hypothetical protein [Gammaproteobacteria bacterium]
TRPQAAAIVAGILALGAVVLWLGLAWVDVYTASFDLLMLTDPEAATAALVLHLKILAILQILPLTAFVGFMIWYCGRAIATQSLPPLGAWIVEGQRINTGAAAVRNARVLLGLTALLAVAGALEIAYVYYIAITLQNGASLL